MEQDKSELQSGHKFLWDPTQNNTSKLYPIDYSVREFADKFGFDTYKLREHLIESPLLKEILYQLPMASESDLYKYKAGSRPKQPLPLEAGEFLACFYRQAKKPGNKAAYCHGCEPPKNLDSFLNDMCQELCEMLLATHSIGDQDAKDERSFGRHVLFANETFKKSAMNSLWKKQLEPRYQKMLELAERAPVEVQANILIKYLLAIDQCILDLSQFRNAPEPVLPDATAALKQMLTDLLSNRTDKASSKYANDLAVFHVPNIEVRCPDQTMNMKTAFSNAADYRHPVKKAVKGCARNAYLSFLAEKKEMPAFEVQYLNIYDYLACTTLPDDSRKLEQAIKTSMKRQCVKIINYCNSSNPDLYNIPPLDFSQELKYIGALINNCIFTLMGKHCQIFQDTIQMIKSFHEYKRINDNIGNMMYANFRLYSKIHHNNMKGFPTEDIMSIIAGRTVVRVPDRPEFSYVKEANIYYQSACEFAELFQTAWSFLCGSTENSTVFDSDLKFIDIEGTSQAFLEKTQAASGFLGAQSPDSSFTDSVAKSFKTYEKIAASPMSIYSFSEYLDGIIPILAGLLTQLLKRIVEDSVPLVLEKVTYISHVLHAE